MKLSNIFAAAFAALPLHAAALTFVTLTGAGSLSDTALRTVAPALERESGEAVVVLNQPGGGGVVGLRHARNMPHAVLVGNSSLGHVQLTGAAPDLDPLNDYVPLYGLTRSEFGVFVSAQSAVTSVSDLKGSLLVGTASPMSVMSAALLDQKLGTSSTVVNYKQFGQALADLAGGRLDYMTGPVNAAAVQGLLQAGRLKQVGTLADLGVADFSWSGFFVHRSTPAEERKRLEGILQRAVNSTPLDGRLAVDGLILRRIQLDELKGMRSAVKVP